MSERPLYGSHWWRLPEISNTSTRCRPMMEGIRSAHAEAVGCSSTHVRSVRGARGAGARLHGHFARFGPWARIDSAREGRFLERIAAGAFTQTIAKDRDQMRCLFQHGKDPSLGDKPIGSIEVLREDDLGAYYEVDLFDGVPPLILNGLRAGAYGASFRFKVNQQRIVDRPGRSEWNPAGLPERTITGATVREFGPVTFGAYSSATAKIAAPAAMPLSLVGGGQPRYAPRRGRGRTRPGTYIYDMRR